MRDGIKRRALCVCAVCLSAALAVVVAGCQPRVVGEEADGAATAVVYKGDYKKYDPTADVSASGGTAIEGSEEEQLQQERIAGGAVGAVVSQNLEPLVGITDPVEDGAYAPSYGMYAEPPAMGHVDMGDDCLGCHTDGVENGQPMPRGHLEANLANEDCRTCHEAR